MIFAGQWHQYSWDAILLHVIKLIKRNIMEFKNLVLIFTGKVNPFLND